MSSNFRKSHHEETLTGVTFALDVVKYACYPLSAGVHSENYHQSLLLSYSMIIIILIRSENYSLRCVISCVNNIN